MIPTTGGLGGPAGNGGAEVVRVAARFAEEDAARRAYLDEACSRGGTWGQDRRVYAGCPECGSRSAHRAGCSQARQARCRCGHGVAAHRGVVCHGQTASGARCRCSRGVGG